MTLEVFFERIQSHYDSELPFVAYRKPNTNDINALLQKNATLFKVEDFNESGFIFSPFDAAEDTILLPRENSEHIATQEPISDFSQATGESVVKKEAHEVKLQYMELVKKGVEAIKEGHFKKVVLSRKEVIDIEEKNPVALFGNLLCSYESAFVYCWYHPKVGLWQGATPETLFKIEGNRFSMMALAGTQTYQGTLDVIWKDKEIEEQQFVTNFILDQITGAVENIKVSKTETVKAGNLLHLKTLIRGTLNFEAINMEWLIRNLHPTPAVCGLPKNEAKAFILKNEAYNRQFYTGFLGELNFETRVTPRLGTRNIENRAYTITRKSTQLYVNLRCMQLIDGHGIIYVGGGVTKTSDPESEWKETVSKSLVIKNALK